MFQVIKRTKIGSNKTFESAGFFPKKSDAQQAALDLVKVFSSSYHFADNGYVAKLPNYGVKVFWVEVN